MSKVTLLSDLRIMTGANLNHSTFEKLRYESNPAPAYLESSRCLWKLPVLAIPKKLFAKTALPSKSSEWLSSSNVQQQKNGSCG
jgi:hypothetical protein